MAASKEFLSAHDEAEIIEAIRRAESNTSGEIRVHIESTTAEDPMKHAEKVFHMLEMDKTEARNGVLIYIATDSKVFVILGDQGINEVVPSDFWNSTKDAMQEHFRKGAFKDGIVKGIEVAGEQLKRYFPWEKGDKNELSDDISRS
jgi:uncharacterized membrane protein